jgi:hypothetical protein
MNRARKAFLVYVDLDPMPGIMHSQESAQNHLNRLIGEYFRPYKPMVSLAPMEAQLPQSIEARTRRAFLVYLDLDPVPGVMHVEENALFMLNRVLESTLTTYDPSAHIAADELQPKEGI